LLSILHTHTPPSYTVNDAHLSRDFRGSIQISTEEQTKLRISEEALVSRPEIEEFEDSTQRAEQTVATETGKLVSEADSCDH
jgi:hypothetical protein